MASIIVANADTRQGTPRPVMWRPRNNMQARTALRGADGHHMTYFEDGKTRNDAKGKKDGGVGKRDRARN